MLRGLETGCIEITLYQFRLDLWLVVGYMVVLMHDDILLNDFDMVSYYTCFSQNLWILPMCN